MKIFDLSRGKIERNYFGIDLELTNAACNDLGVLRSEIENKIFECFGGADVFIC